MSPKRQAKGAKYLLDCSDFSPGPWYELWAFCSLSSKRIKPGAFFGKIFEESSMLQEGAVKNKRRDGIQKAKKCQWQPDVCSPVSKTERQNTDSTAPGNHYLFPVKN
jgi:hypothetical protein